MKKDFITVFSKRPTALGERHRIRRLTPAVPEEEPQPERRFSRGSPVTGPKRGSSPYESTELAPKFPKSLKVIFPLVEEQCSDQNKGVIERAIEAQHLIDWEMDQAKKPGQMDIVLRMRLISEYLGIKHSPKEEYSKGGNDNAWNVA
ncbi:S Phase Cyclin A-Associated Protein In The Endoplasmic Reticulum [Manis pentadactyla]|nr:S Phase Cyclin A-Associated Protein In The Endoplasmic Reticulum [Manis pentadactyla]